MTMPARMKQNNQQSIIDLSHMEEMLRDKGYQTICGVDEVGRGYLAAPVVAAAVILPAGIVIEGLADSKRLTSSRRDELFDEIVSLEIPCAVGIIDNEEIDRLNILKASLLAMRKAVTDLKATPEIVLVDGDYPIPKIAYPQLSIINGDNLCDSIKAASIVAKVTRDRIMDRYEKMYPAFSFSQHKGYYTAAHMSELKMHGPCDIHRKSFRPVAELVEQYALT